MSEPELRFALALPADRPFDVVGVGVNVVNDTHGRAESAMAPTTRFDARSYLPRDLYAAVTEIRAREPDYADAQAWRRKRRPTLAPDGKLVILAVDHPGRNTLKVQDEPLEVVAGATTLPIAVLGGEAVGSVATVLEDLRTAMAAGANVRSAMIGRNVVYPGADDPRAMAAAVAAVIRDGADVATALAAMEAERGKDPQLVP